MNYYNLAHKNFVLLYKGYLSFNVQSTLTRKEQIVCAEAMRIIEHMELVSETAGECIRLDVPSLNCYSNNPGAKRAVTSDP